MFIPVGTVEHVSVIDKICNQPAISFFFEDGLPAVGVYGTGIDKPSQPKGFWISYSLETGSRQDFQERLAIVAQKMGAEAKAGIRPKSSFRSLNPTIWVAVKERIGDTQSFPRRN